MLMESTWGASVSCGHYTAATCSECSRDQDKGHGWCSGDCVLIADECLNQLPTDVECGGHKARNCSSCPQGHGAGWCNGDCVWAMGECISKVGDSSDTNADAAEVAPAEAASTKSRTKEQATGELYVSCGRHNAPSCSACPQGKGAVWCNGDCVWNVTLAECVPKHPSASTDSLPADVVGTVSCGRHRASSCSECPQGRGVEFCNGDCLWLRKECVERKRVRRLKNVSIGRRAKVSCGRHQAASCAECPQGNGASWCNGECVWYEDECILGATLATSSIHDEL